MKEYKKTALQEGFSLDAVRRPNDGDSTAVRAEALAPFVAEPSSVRAEGVRANLVEEPRAQEALQLFSKQTTQVQSRVMNSVQNFLKLPVSKDVETRASIGGWATYFAVGIAIFVVMFGVAALLGLIGAALF